MIYPSLISSANKTHNVTISMKKGANGRPALLDLLAYSFIAIMCFHLGLLQKLLGWNSH